MEFTLKRSGHFRGYRIQIDSKDESMIIENARGAQVARLKLEDLLDRLGATKHGLKRRYPRLELGVHVKYFNADGHLCEGIASTIGGGGLFIEQLNPLREGTETRLEFTLPASRSLISCRANVAWVRQNFLQKFYYPGMGLQFTDISERDRAELIHFVNMFNEQRGLQEF